MVPNDKIYFLGNHLFNEFQTCTVEDIKQALDVAKVISIDIETGRRFKKNLYRETVYKPGLDPYMSRIVMLQIYDGKNAYVIDARVIDISFIKPYLESERILKIGQNLAFETRFFLVHLNCRMNRIWDTFIVEKILYNGENRGMSLEALAQNYLQKKSVKSISLFDDSFDRSVQKGIVKAYDAALLSGDDKVSYDDVYATAYEEAMNDYIDKGTRLGFVEMGDRPFTVKEIKYGAADVVDPYEIFWKQKRGRMVGGEQYCPIQAFKDECDFVRVKAEVEVCGMTVDAIKWKELYEQNLETKAYRRFVLDNYIEENHLDFCTSMGLFSGRPTCAISWSSSDQVVRFFKSIDKCPLEYSPQRKRKVHSVGAKVMFRLLPNNYKSKFFKQDFPDEIKSNDDLILAYLLYKKSEQLTSTFGIEWLKFIHPITGRVHANYRQYLISNRLAASNPNLNQIPGSKAFRSCFVPRLAFILNADYSAQEIRVAAEVHNNPRMKAFFTEPNDFNGDFHAFSATNMFRVIQGDPNYRVPPKELEDGEKNPEFSKEHGEQRNKSKNITFKLNYGGTEFTLAADLGITEEEAKAFMDAFFEGFPGLLEAFNAAKKKAVEVGWIRLDPLTDKRYFFPNFGRLEEIIDEAAALKPANYKQLSPEEKDVVKQQLREETNWTDLWREYFQLKNKLERRALNLPIQGSSASMTKRAGIKIHNWIAANWTFKESLENCYLDLFMHDEIGGQSNEEYAETFAKVIETAMQAAGKDLYPTVPMVAQCAITDHWQH